MIEEPVVDNPWLRVSGGTAGPGYAARFAELAAAGEDLHGEARRVHALLGGTAGDTERSGAGPPTQDTERSGAGPSTQDTERSGAGPSTQDTERSGAGPSGADVLDAGCGTGRVAIRLAELGHRVVGVDLDASMLDEARAAAPGMTWVRTDLAELDLPGPVDLVVAAGNLWPLLTPGTHARVVSRLAAHLRPGGLLVAGFGLDDEHVPFTLPDGVPFPTLAAYDEAAGAAGLVLETRSADWAGQEPYEGGGYAVSVHRREVAS